VNNAASDAAQRRNAALRNEERGTDIDRKDFIPLIGGNLFYVGSFKDSGVVDEHVDVAKAFQDGFDSVFGAFWPAKIAFKGKSFHTFGFDLF